MADRPTSGTVTKGKTASRTVTRRATSGTVTKSTTATRKR